MYFFVKIKIDMLENFRQRMASYFDVPEQEQYSSVKLGWIFLWFAIAGIIGGISPFIWPTNHGVLVSAITSALFIILTAKMNISTGEEADEEDIPRCY